jgi:uncharacterized BrkB/YihY/UPF0761 family membrane protein
MGLFFSLISKNRNKDVSSTRFAYIIIVCIVILLLLVCGVVMIIDVFRENRIAMDYAGIAAIITALALLLGAAGYTKSSTNKWENNEEEEQQKEESKDPFEHLRNLKIPKKL